MDVRERVLRLIDYAENLQRFKDALERQKYNLYTIFSLIAVSFVGLLYAALNSTLANLGTSLNISATVVLLLFTFTSILKYRRTVQLERRELDAIRKSTGLLREYLPREINSPEWGALDRAEVELRLSRLPIGASHSWQAVNESIPLYNNFQDIEWKGLFEKSKKLTIFVAYARTWRNRNLAHLQAMLSREGSSLTVILPSRTSPETISILAKRFAISNNGLLDRIDETIAEYKSMRNSRIEIREVDVVPSVTYYLFDEYAVVAFYTHARDRRPVPALVATKSSQLYDFVQRELELLMAESKVVNEDTILRG